MRTFERALPMMMYRVLDAVMPEFRAIFARFELTEPQWRVLRALWDDDGQTVSALSGLTLIDAPVLVGVIDRLERDGLVTRRRSQTDRRRVHVHLTPRGRRLEQEVRPLVDEAYARLDATLSPEEWRLLYATLDKLCANACSAQEARSRRAAGASE